MLRERVKLVQDEVMIHWVVLNLSILIWPLPCVDTVTEQCCYSKHPSLAPQGNSERLLLLFENIPAWKSWWQRNLVCEISGSHNSVAEDSVIQGCDAVTQCHNYNYSASRIVFYLPLILKLPYCMHLLGITASLQPFWVKDQNTKGFVTGNYTRPCTASIRKNALHLTIKILHNESRLYKK